MQHLPGDGLNQTADFWRVVPQILGTIERVPDNGVMDGGKMDANLMGATGQQVNLEKGRFDEMLEASPTGQSISSESGGDGHFFSVCGVAADGLVDESRSIRHVTMNQNQVFFCDCSGFELRG